jgi:hypothetical protein
MQNNYFNANVRFDKFLFQDGDGQTNSPSPPQHEDNNSPGDPPQICPPQQPPPYQATPTGRPTQPLSQSLALSHPHQQSLVNRFEPTIDNSRLNNTTLENGTFNQTDNALQYTHYSLPSPNQSRYFPEEEAELEELMDKLDQAFPMDMTHSCKAYSVNLYQLFQQRNYCSVNCFINVWHLEIFNIWYNYRRNFCHIIIQIMIVSFNLLSCQSLTMPIVS